MEVITAELNRLNATQYEDLVQFVYTNHTQDMPESIVRNIYNYLKCMFLASYIKNLLTGRSNGEYIKMVRTGPKQADIYVAEDFSHGKELVGPLAPGTYILYLNGLNEYHHACVVVEDARANVISVWGGTRTIYTVAMEPGRLWSNLKALTTLPAAETAKVLKETFMDPSEEFEPCLDYPGEPFFEEIGYEQLLPSL